jgi:hypothetical protein
MCGFNYLVYAFLLCGEGGWTLTVSLLDAGTMAVVCEVTFTKPFSACPDGNYSEVGGSGTAVLA